MAFTVPTYDEAVEFLRSLGRALLPSRDWSPLGMGGKWSAWFSGAVTDLHAHISAAIADLLPDTAAGDALDRWGAIRGVTRKAATGARKAAALRVTGTTGASITAGTELTSSAGLRYQITENETWASDGTKDLDVAAIDVGSQTRLPAGEVLTFTSPPAGIEEEAELVLDLDEEGFDREADGAYRNRILAKFADPPLGGARADYEQWALEIEGNETAYVYPIRAGFGSVDVAALHGGRGTARLLTGGEVAELQAYLEARCPVDVVSSVRALTVAGQEVDVEVTVQVIDDPLYAFDWDDSPALSVAAWTAGTRTVQFSAARPDTMKAGDRLTIKPAAGGGTGEQYVIESLVSTDSVVLEEAPVPAPAATDTVYSGGALVDEIRDAILEHLDSLGPSNTDANPYGSWEGNLRPANLFRVVQGIVGVRQSTIVDPAVTVEPPDDPYPDDDTVYLLIPRRVLVRRQ